MTLLSVMVYMSSFEGKSNNISNSNGINIFQNALALGNSNILSSQSQSSSFSTDNNNNNNFNNYNSRSTNLPYPTNLFDINKTISNTTAYRSMSLFLKNHNASELPTPSANRMFTSDKAQILRVYQDPLILELVHLPKNLIAGQPSTFILNNFAKNGTWLWHSDYDIFIKNASSGQTMLAMPNQHGHGSMIQFAYTFPFQGVYDISVIYGQQVNSPNFIGTHFVRQANFQVHVQLPNNNPSAANSKNSNTTLLSPPTLALPISLNNASEIANVGFANGSSNNNTIQSLKQMSLQTQQQSSSPHVKDITINVKSWSYTPNKIEVNKGDLVRLHFVTANDEVSLYNGHGFGIDGYDINTFLVKGTQQELQFIADKAGIFTFRCTSFCAWPDADPMNHYNMIGSLIVHG